MRWTQEQLDEYEVKRRPAPASIDQTHKADPGPESSLLRKITAYCHEHGYYAWHDRSRGVNEAGFPDLVVCLPEGRVMFLELKSEDGKLRKEQAEVRIKLLALKAEWFEVRSFKRFLEIIGGV